MSGHCGLRVGIPELDTLRIVRNMPVKRVMKLKHVRCGSVDVYQGASGTIYCPAIPSNGIYMSTELWWQSGLVEGLVRLGVVPAGVADRFETLRNNALLLERIRNDAKELVRIGSKYDLPVKQAVRKIQLKIRRLT